jgi:transaldolase
MPHAWQVKFNASSIEVRPRIDEPVDAAIVGELLERVPDFGHAYEPDGLEVDAFDRFGATVRTLRQFMTASDDLVAAVRDFVVPNPDISG